MSSTPGLKGKRTTTSSSNIHGQDRSRSSLSRSGKTRSLQNSRVLSRQETESKQSIDGKHNADGKQAAKKAPEQKKKTKLTYEQETAISYRLSRVPQKFNRLSAAQLEQKGSWIENYYSKEGKEKMDLTEPEIKLNDIRAALDGGASGKERITLLTQQKTLCYILFEEVSNESCNAHYELGTAYKGMEFYDSALRHLNKAHEIDAKLKDKTTEEEEKRSSMIHLEISETYYGKYKKAEGEAKGKKSPTKKNNELVSNALSNIEKFDFNAFYGENETLYRAYIIKARAENHKKNFDAASNDYGEAVNCKEILQENEDTEELADLKREYAECYEKTSSADKESTVQLYRAAYDMYKRLDLVDKMKEIEPKIMNDDSDLEISTVSDPYAPITTDDPKTFKDENDFKEKQEEEEEKKEEEEKSSKQSSKQNSDDEEKKESDFGSEHEEKKESDFGSEKEEESKPQLHFGAAIKETLNATDKSANFDESFEHSDDDEKKESEHNSAHEYSQKDDDASLGDLEDSNKEEDNSFDDHKDSHKDNDNSFSDNEEVHNEEYKSLDNSEDDEGRHEEYKSLDNSEDDEGRHEEYKSSGDEELGFDDESFDNKDDESFDNKDNDEDDGFDNDDSFDF